MQERQKEEDTELACLIKEVQRLRQKIESQHYQKRDRLRLIVACRWTVLDSLS